MEFPELNSFFNLADFDHKLIFEGIEYPWQILKKLGRYVDHWLKKKGGQNQYFGRGTVIDKTSRIEGAVITGANCLIGFQAHLRGPLVLGNNCHIIKSELKHSLFLSDVHAAHFSYIGDSIIGNMVNFGGGAKVANLRLDKEKIKVKYKRKIIRTGLKKFGAVIGDRCQLGANSVLNPGTILAEKSIVYPLVCVKARFYQKESIIKK